METGKKNIVIIGAGYGGITAGLRAARLLRRYPDYQIHLIDKNPYHTLKTQLHEAAVRRTEVTIPVDRIIRNRNILFHLEEVDKVDPVNFTVHMGKTDLPFSYLVLALGGQANFYGIPGLKEFAFPLQTFQDAQRIYDHITELCSKASAETNEQKRRALLRFVIGGGGLSGVEFASELADYIVKNTHDCHIPLSELEIVIVESEKRIVPYMKESFAETIKKKLTEKKVKVLTGTKIINQTPEAVSLSSGEVLKTKTLIWTGGISISGLMNESGLKTGHSGRVLVDKFLRIEGFSFIYAIGDNALAVNPATGNPVPAAAQFALQQGRLAADNIYAEITGKEKKIYRPKVMGEIVGLGRHLAVGWLALPFLKKFTFAGFVGSLIKTAIQEKHIMLLRKESRNWVKY
jgi:NADH:ubiquinone reductase (H+-translocating)